MHWYYRALNTVWLLALLGCTSKTLQSITVSSSARGECSLSPTVIDLGKVRLGQTKHFTSSVSNQLNRPLSFQRFHTSCSCSDLKISSKHLPPQQSLPIEGQFRGQPPFGPFRREIKLLFAELNETPTLILTGEVYRDLIIEPASIELHPDPSQGQGDHQQVILRNRGDQSVKVRFENLPAGINVKVSPEEIQAGSSAKARIEVDPYFLSREKCELYATTSHPTENRLQLPALITPREGILVQPNAFRWGIIQEKDWRGQLPLKVRLKGKALKHFHLKSIKTPRYLNWVNPTEYVHANDSLFLFDLSSASQPLDLNGEIAFHLEVKANQRLITLKIPVSGVLRGVP
jgi:hypothetical protein